MLHFSASVYLEKGLRKRKRKTYDDMLADVRSDWKRKYRKF